jgi:hypothetical protein
MDLTKVLAHLHAELDKLDAAIASLQRLQQGDQRRGRPALSLQKSGKKTAERRAAKPKPSSRHAGELPPTEEG